MYRGKGPPIMVSQSLNKTVYLPKPVMGKRRETFKDEKEVYTNIDGKRIPMDSKFRFIGEYEFGQIDSGVLDDIITVHTAQSVCKWIPHSDFAMVNYMVVIKEVTPEYLKGNVYYDTVKIKVETVDYIYKIPTIDNMIAGYLPTRIGVYNV